MTGRPSLAMYKFESQFVCNHEIVTRDQKKEAAWDFVFRLETDVAHKASLKHRTSALVNLVDMRLRGKCGCRVRSSKSMLA